MKKIFLSMAVVAMMGVAMVSCGKKDPVVAALNEATESINKATTVEELVEAQNVATAKISECNIEDVSALTEEQQKAYQECLDALQKKAAELGGGF